MESQGSNRFTVLRIAGVAVILNNQFWLQTTD